MRANNELVFVNFANASQMPRAVFSLKYRIKSATNLVSSKASRADFSRNAHHKELCHLLLAPVRKKSLFGYVYFNFCAEEDHLICVPRISIPSTTLVLGLFSYPNELPEFARTTLPIQTFVPAHTLSRRLLLLPPFFTRSFNYMSP